MYAASTVNANIRSAGQKGGRERRKRSNTPRSRATITLARNFCSTDRVTASEASQVVTLPTTPQAVTHPTTPQAVTLPTTPQAVTYPTAPQVVTHSTMPRVAAHSTTPQAVTRPTAPQVVTHSTMPRVVAHFTTPQAVTHTTMPQTVTHNFSLPLVVTYSGVKPWRNSNLFVIMTITNRVKNCAGCPFEYSNPHGPVFTGLEIQHKERDVHHDKEGNTRITIVNNLYNFQASIFHTKFTFCT